MDQEFFGINSLSEWESFIDSNRIPGSSIGSALNRLLELTTADLETSVGNTKEQGTSASSDPAEDQNCGNEDLESEIVQLGGGQTREPPSKNPLQCGACGRSFKRKFDLKRHEKEIHGGDKKHPCPQCNKKFKRKTDVRRHVINIHERPAVQREFKCDVCGETFGKLTSFRSHQATSHKKKTLKRSAPADTSEASYKKRKSGSLSQQDTENDNPRWVEDPRAIERLPPDQRSQIPEYRRHWGQIRTRFSRRNKLLNWYNFRLSSLQPETLLRQLNQVFNDQVTVFKLNVAFGFLLRNNESNKLQYHYTSRNNNQVFDEPFQISNLAELEPVLDSLRNLDILEWARQHRPNSKWIVEQVTNVTYFVTKVINHPIGKGGKLPHYIVRNRGMYSLDCDDRTGNPYQDNLCFFRALALHNGAHLKNLERDTKHYFERYCQTHLLDQVFHGITLQDLPNLEKLFEVNIFVYSLEPSECEDNEEESDSEPEISAQLVCRSHRNYGNNLYLNIYEDHFSYIFDLQKYSKSFRCSRCGKYWKHSGMLHRHERTCEAKVRYTFPGGVYNVPRTIFDLLEDEGIDIPPHLKFFPYRATFDFECMFNHEDHPTNTEKMQWQAKHVPISVSICSNVPGHDLSHCFVSTGDSKHLVKDMVDYLIKISEKSYCLMKKQFDEVFKSIEDKLREKDQVKEKDNHRDGREEEGINVMESDDEDEEEFESETDEDRAFLNDEDSIEENELSFYRALNQEQGERKPIQRKTEKTEHDKRQHPLLKLKVRLENYLKELPVVGFNSGKYDLNAVKEFLIPVLVEQEQIQCTIKRNNNFMSLNTEHLKFLDITNFLAPGFSYDKFLKAYGCPQSKGYFPYEWMDSLEKLGYPSLPPHQAFFSSLTNKNISEEEYFYCQQVWSDNNMQTFRDFLVWYNNLDVQPFCLALEKMCQFWKDKNIDMLRQGISIPGVTLTYLFMTLEPGIYFSLFDENNKDLYTLFKSNMVGGPSIIFHIYHEKQKTKIREQEMVDKGREPKMCQKVVGYDANALYLWAIMQDMPTGAYTRRREENHFKKESSVKMATQWLEWEALRSNIVIRHNMNNTEKRIGQRRLPVDGFHGPSNTVFQFQGCWWHGHNCHLTAGKEYNERRKKPMVELLEETQLNSQYIRDEGFTLVEMWECEWRELRRNNSNIQQFLRARFERPLDRYWTLTQQQILESVKDGSLFGCVECDVRVPDHLKEKFGEMCPIFKNTTISREDIGAYMRQFAEQHRIMPKPRRSLIGSYFGDKILLATPLLKWYLEHGLEVTRVYQVTEYSPVSCFRPFGEAVSNARRAGDVHPDKAVIAETMKLVGNSSYGKTITDQERHRNIKFCEEIQASQLINSPFFRQIDSIDENTYEVQSCKKNIKLNLPLQIGFFVYQYAKLRMLQFYFDFIDKYIDRSDFQYCEMDTDSAYIAISGNSVEELVRPELKEDFNQDICNWFPRKDTLEHEAYDKRTPGLFKEEWSGDGIIGLCSKTYYCFGASDKFSCKGVSKRCSEVNKDKYLKVLLTKQSSSGLNRGFRVVKNSIYTYNQIRDGFSYFYPKRKVLEDGITTIPLDI